MKQLFTLQTTYHFDTIKISVNTNISQLTVILSNINEVSIYYSKFHTRLKDMAVSIRINEEFETDVDRFS